MATWQACIAGDSRHWQKAAIGGRTMDLHAPQLPDGVRRPGMPRPDQSPAVLRGVVVDFIVDVAAVQFAVETLPAVWLVGHDLTGKHSRLTSPVGGQIAGGFFSQRFVEQRHRWFE